jgi:xanthine dehydrogenase YagR molybdenum-binding subunit
VIAIVTADRCRQARQGQVQHRQAAGRARVDHYHQAIAVVVAETFEQARAAAGLVRVDYARTRGASISRSAKTAPLTDADKMAPARPRESASAISKPAFAAAPVQARRGSIRRPITATR